MMAWEEAVTTFIDSWKSNNEVVAALVCGSYVTGKPSTHSDIDIHIILNDEVEWRERGNRYVDGFLIEYFINPPRQIRKYFEEDYNDNSTMSMVQFITGKVLFDNLGIINILKSEAMDWKNKGIKEQNDSSKEIKKYGIWDTMDNLHDCYESNRSDFHFVYYNSLLKLFSDYSYILGVEQIPHYQIYNYLTKPLYLSKYLKIKFPDDIFSKLFLSCIQATDRKKMMKLYEQLTSHLLSKTGDFQIDGWRIRSSVE
jgi:hypothetical protein